METETPADTGRGGGIELDPEDDARDALVILRGYVLSDIPADSVDRVESWVDLDSYIGDLCSHGLDTLIREPDSLSVECIRLRTQLEEVSCNNYRALIESFECAGTVRDGVGKIRSRLDLLIDALPPLATATREFSSRAAEVQIEREVRLRTLAEYGRVFDLLEIPRLMRSLVAGELYEEALELRDMALKVSSMHDEDAILHSVREEVDALTRQMILQLIGDLRGALPLPTCLRVVGFLRRLSVFSESRLRMLFLHCRGEWMRSSLEAGIAPNAQAKLVHLCDDTRAMVFEIITQYRAAFIGDEDEPVELTPSEFDGRQPKVWDSRRTEGFENTGGGRSEGQHIPSSAILSDWTASHVSRFLSKLEEGLADIRDGASLGTVLQQAMYSGQSLGRVGADFRPALVPLFEKAIMRIVSSHLNSALRQFEMMIEDHRWAPVGSSALRQSRIQRDSLRMTGRESGTEDKVREGLEENNVACEDNSVENEANATISLYEPPIPVLDSPPLAVFLNGILAALNELRSCALLSLSDEIARCMGETLLHAAECMSSIGGPGGAFLKASDRQHFDSMHLSLVGLCIPHVARCVDHCMDQRGLVEVEKLVADMGILFGESLSQPVIAGSVAKNGSQSPAEDTCSTARVPLEGSLLSPAGEDSESAKSITGVEVAASSESSPSSAPLEQSNGSAPQPSGS